jgi:hypothetical protein
MTKGDSKGANALVLAKLYRAAGSSTWLLRALGTECNGREASAHSVLTACGINPAAPIPDPASCQGKSKSKQHRSQEGDKDENEDDDDDGFGDFVDNDNSEGESSFCIIA